MQALKFKRPGNLVLINCKIPSPGHDEVLIKVAYAGICGTDLHIIAGDAPSADEVVLGHEFSGIVTETGKNVSAVKTGQHVVVDPNNYCGFCLYCRKGQVHFCENLSPIGIDHDGGWAKYCVVPAEQVYLLPESASLEWGALCEPFSCIIHGWDRIQPAEADQSVCIIGAGLIGLLWDLFLKSRGIDNIQISEPNEKRRGIAAQLGLKACTPKGLHESNTGFDIIIDCSGNVQAIEQSLQWANPLAKILLFGIAPQSSRMRISPFHIFQKELTILGSVINPFTFSRAIEAINPVQCTLDKLGVEFFSLDDYQAALESSRSGRVTKSIFKLC